MLRNLSRLSWQQAIPINCLITTTPSLPTSGIVSSSVLIATRILCWSWSMVVYWWLHNNFICWLNRLSLCFCRPHVLFPKQNIDRWNEKKAQNARFPPPCSTCYTYDVVWFARLHSGYFWIKTSGTVSLASSSRGVKRRVCVLSLSSIHSISHMHRLLLRTVFSSLVSANVPHKFSWELFKAGKCRQGKAYLTSPWH